MPDIIWQAPEFEYHHKGVSWYWLTVILAVLLVSMAVWQRNFLFGAFVVIAEILVLTWGARKPGLATFRAGEKEFIINDRERYPWTDFANFRVDDGEGGFSVVFRFRSRIRPPLRVFVPQEQFANFKGILAGRCAQSDDPKSFAETMEDLFRL